ncbi:MAG: lysozyme inhibitor LprI family protein [Bacteroidota bacterium]
MKKTTKFIAFVLTLALLANTAWAQDTSDVVRLRNLSYMKLEVVERVDCDATIDNLSARICRNLAFQAADAKLNELYVSYIDQIENDSIRKEEKDYHAAWVAHRRRLSHQAAEGYRGHVLGLIYLGYMTHLTEVRIEELRYLLEGE